MFSVVNMGDFEQPKPLHSPDETEHSSPCFFTRAPPCITIVCTPIA